MIISANKRNAFTNKFVLKDVFHLFMSARVILRKQLKASKINKTKHTAQKMIIPILMNYSLTFISQSFKK